MFEYQKEENAVIQQQLLKKIQKIDRDILFLRSQEEQARFKITEPLSISFEVTL